MIICGRCGGSISQGPAFQVQRERPHESGQTDVREGGESLEANFLIRADDSMLNYCSVLLNSRQEYEQNTDAVSFSGNHTFG